MVVFLPNFKFRETAEKTRTLFISSLAHGGVAYQFTPDFTPRSVSAPPQIKFRRGLDFDDREAKI